MAKIMIPPITVLMPVYNAEAYIGQAIESILNQTFRNYEFIIINDGSSDKSDLVIQSFTDDRIVYRNHSQNQGLISTLNEGIAIATGKYIARMDNDDISVSTRLEKQYLFMESNPEIDILGSWFSEIGSEIKKTLPVNDAECKVKLLQSNVFGHPTMFIRKESVVREGLKYNSSFLHAEDYRLWTESAIKGLKLANFPEILLNYRVYPEQTSKLMFDIQSDTSNQVRLYYGEYYFKNLIQNYKGFYLELLDATISNYESYLWAKKFVKKAIDQNERNNYMDQSCLKTLFETSLDYCARFQYALWQGDNIASLTQCFLDKRFYRYLSIKGKIKFLTRCLKGICN
jgi:glycosyltransferase involved in cell wall biosynthesis